MPAEHRISVRCYETMGVPNSVATCSCGESKTYYPGAARRDGFKSDLLAACAWRCPNTPTDRPNTCSTD